MKTERALAGRALVATVVALAGLGFLSAARPEPAAPARRPADNVLVVTLDGIRWQEVFAGFDASVGNKEDGGVADPAALAQRFFRPTAEARREILLPFLWTVVAKDGQIFGDPSRASTVRVTNGLRFSYPGYNELLTGSPDPRIDSNDKKPNPNLTVLEWLNGRPPFAGRVAAFGSWDVLPFIVAADRARIPVNGDGLSIPTPSTPRDLLLNDFTSDLPTLWQGTSLDAPTMQGALEFLRTRKPRVLYVMLGETDEWAHGRRYDQYLDAAWRADRFLKRLWETAQAMPSHRGKTALLVATDHGRGATPRDWTDHGKEVPAAENLWVAAMGPATPALGVRAGVQSTQSQFAASIAALLGEDFKAAVPKAAPPLPDLTR